MSKRRQKINPMADVVAKKLFSDPDITTDFIQTFLGFRPTTVTIRNGTIAHLKEERDGHFSTSVDVLARLEDGTQVIIEIQLAHQESFIKRLWTYSCQHVVNDLPKVRGKVTKTHDMYDKVTPIYAIALVGSRYFADHRPVHTYTLADRQTGEPLLQAFGKMAELKPLFQMVIVELKKYRHQDPTSKQRLWLEFFANRSFSRDPTPAIERAEHLLDQDQWTEEETKMFESWLKNTSAHFGEIETGYKRGEKKGLEAGEQKGRLEATVSVAQSLLKSGFDDAFIAHHTNLSVDDIALLRSGQQLSL